MSDLKSIPAEAVELGPDGKEWAKTEAGYRHVASVVASAVTGADAAYVWHGHIVRNAFVAGAEWQEVRSALIPIPADTSASAVMEAAREEGRVQGLIEAAQVARYGIDRAERDFRNFNQAAGARRMATEIEEAILRPSCRLASSKREG